uniref:SGNH hydrolase-type esterase domain-containing protein n=1 Tax=Knipowitschia caucasica TaxID=637954 RepID=A0AAV2JU49_KNICA
MESDTAMTTNDISRLTLELRERDRATIADLRKEVLRLTAELQDKQSLVSKLFDVAGGQHSRLMSLSAAYCDTVVWERSVSSGPSCSTPKCPVRNKEPADCEEPSSAVAHVLSLSNRYAALSADIPAPSAEPLDSAANSTAVRGSSASPPLTFTGSAAATRACSSRCSTSPCTQRGLPGAGNQHPRSPPCVQQRPGSDPSLDEPAGSGHGHRAPSPRLRPLFAPTTLIVGDSIVRHVRFFNAVTHCITGATVPDLLIRLPPLLQSLPDTISKVIVHVGINDMKLQQSEVTKKHFMDLFRLLQSSGLCVFISGPVPTVNRGDCLYSRVVALNMWLQSACSTFNFVFVNNFGLFWKRHVAYRPDVLPEGGVTVYIRGPSAPTTTFLLHSSTG